MIAQGQQLNAWHVSSVSSNYRMAANAAFVKAGATDVRAYQFPCYELVRIAARRTPRGFKRGKGGLEPLPGDDWPSRFVAAGGELYERGTRMIAAKTSDVWQKLGDGAGGHTDTLGNPYAPFAFGSGYGLREVPREEALLIGVPFDGGIPQTLQMQLKAEAKQYDPALLAKLEADLKRDDAKQTLSLSERARERARAAARAYQLKNRTEALCHLLNARVKNPGATVTKAWVTRKLRKREIQQGADALKIGLRGRKDVEKAMTVPGLGFIDFLWGSRGAKAANVHGTTHEGGWGIEHIHSKRGMKAIKVLPVVMARGRVLKHPKSDRRFIRHKHWTAVVQRREEGRWRVMTLIDDDVASRSHKIKNKAARLPSRSTGPATQVRTGLDFPGSTHSHQLNAEVTAGAAKDSRLTGLHARCKGLLNLLHGHV